MSLLEPTKRPTYTASATDACGDDPWLVAMRRGDFAAAWEVSDRVLQRRLAADERCTHWPRHLQFVWRGQSLVNRRVLVRCYHGLGDTLQFARFATPLSKIAREVIFWVQPSLLSLVATIRGIDRCMPLHDGVPEVDYDVDVEVMELPHALRVSLQTLPNEVPYLRAAPNASELVQIDKRNRLHPRLHIGVAWQAGEWNRPRSLGMRELDELHAANGVRFYSLQRDVTQAELQALCGNAGVSDLGCLSIAAMAAHMTQLDLVISVDTMVAHLAGALGLPVWTLLQHDCDWRWMLERRDTPWYPSMRLFRQAVNGRWQPVIAEVLRALRELQGVAV